MKSDEGVLISVGEQREGWAIDPFALMCDHGLTKFALGRLILLL